MSVGHRLLQHTPTHTPLTVPLVTLHSPFILRWMKYLLDQLQSGIVDFKIASKYRNLLKPYKLTLFELFAKVKLIKEI